ncbi:hypothetical protein RHSIM_Rhsim10G0110100 [Rhododendron simsii]|uniref:Retrotransposon gag domain-containing protein n=1 Tax=Rhododendron simsii TaxID=118357 RepID=A0A834GDQ0_RHOSS|nr:hypothetical protein RHSIM_Rhsim10G0110100 [Rhododendron simsii]
MSNSSDSITIDEWGPLRVKGNHAQHVDQDSHEQRVQYRAKEALTGEISRIEEYFRYYTKEQKKSSLKKRVKSNCLVWFKAFKMIGEQLEEMKELEKKAKKNPPIRVRHHIPSEGSCSVKPLSPGDSKSMEFQNLTQKPGMTVAQYEAEFTTFAHYAPHLIPDENMKARRFEGGLNPDLCKLGKSLKLPTYAEVLDWSLMLEDESAKIDHMSEPKKRKNEDENTSNGQTK